jgi:hypothetical protein
MFQHSQIPEGIGIAGAALHLIRPADFFLSGLLVS